VSKGVISIIFLLFILNGCAISTNHYTPQKRYVKKEKKIYKLPREPIYGLASFYGYKWNGRVTASGERLNIYAMTAAHKSLPFNTIVKVTNLNTGKYIYVRINDRGPFVKGRVIDLTDAAASKLGILKQGIARVKVEVVKLG
jgi:rare lipoprotein A